MPLLSPPIVIGHRGASGSRPEHTRAAYELAIDQGADAIEPDLVPTADDVLVIRHENEIGGTTDVAARREFAGRHTTKVVDGQVVEGWFTEDFTLAELKTLRARERLPELRPESAAYDGRFELLTFADLLDLAKARGVAVHAEVKHAHYFASVGHPTDRLILDALRRVGWDAADAPVAVQSFEIGNLKRLHAASGVRLVQLLESQGAPADGAAASYAAMTTPAGLAEVARYAWAIGPNKALLWREEGDAGLVAGAHAAGLRVFPWTYRAERAFVPERYDDMSAELSAALRLGTDGFFTDHPAIGREVVGSFE